MAIVEPTIRTTKKMAIHCSVSIHEGTSSPKLDVSLPSDTLNCQSDEYTRMSSRSALPVFELILLFVLVFVLQMVTSVADLVGELFVLQPPVQENPWTVVTSVFAHADTTHLISNAVTLAIVGIPVALYTTRARFHAFFIAAGAIAGVSQIVLSDAFTTLPFIGFTASPGVLGASGGVFALLGYLLAGNRVSSTLGSLIDAPRWLSYVVYFVLAAVLTLATATPGAALIAHFTGLLVGLLAGRLSLLDPTDRKRAEPAVS